ncbi:uncharacterized protein [Triticum aestivum]|uniref:uncharacterized protein isoform X2 n=1 Tax=Triticum aestivum TaxID=4565 RepID=UPI001D033714|nr:uncharacterized protein LOC123044975 isoform X2 [Triticum aestivum]XP_044323816.1 uncharacterized protein LOC123044975 isoform X2 [Triticum aestivum]XP_044323817.1 uncharacterized protein LOC123044975 isoform X2 [Triticum aestivum]XP_044323818.1 uncharacterized protein LOC123044975 isoform X2 [Triticum aestivum]
MELHRPDAGAGSRRPPVGSAAVLVSGEFDGGCGARCLDLQRQQLRRRDPASQAGPRQRLLPDGQDTATVMQPVVYIAYHSAVFRNPHHFHGRSPSGADETAMSAGGHFAAPGMRRMGAHSHQALCSSSSKASDQRRIAPADNLENMLIGQAASWQCKVRRTRHTTKQSNIHIGQVFVKLINKANFVVRQSAHHDSNLSQA